MNKRQYPNGEILIAFYGKKSHSYECGIETDKEEDERLLELRNMGFSNNYRAHFSAQKMLELGYHGGNHGVLMRWLSEAKFKNGIRIFVEDIKDKIGLVLDSVVFPNHGRYYRMLFNENDIVWLHCDTLTKITPRMKKKMAQITSKKSR